MCKISVTLIFLRCFLSAIVQPTITPVRVDTPVPFPVDNPVPVEQPILDPIPVPTPETIEVDVPEPYSYPVPIPTPYYRVHKKSVFYPRKTLVAVPYIKKHKNMLSKRHVKKKEKEKKHPLSAEDLSKALGDPLKAVCEGDADCIGDGLNDLGENDCKGDPKCVGKALDDVMDGICKGNGDCKGKGKDALNNGPCKGNSKCIGNAADLPKKSPKYRDPANIKGVSPTKKVKSPKFPSKTRPSKRPTPDTTEAYTKFPKIGPISKFSRPQTRKPNRLNDQPESYNEIPSDEDETLPLTSTDRPSKWDGDTRKPVVGTDAPIGQMPSKFQTPFRDKVLPSPKDEISNTPEDHLPDEYHYPHREDKEEPINMQDPTSETPKDEIPEDSAPDDHLAPNDDDKKPSKDKKPDTGTKPSKDKKLPDTTPENEDEGSKDPTDSLKKPTEADAFDPLTPKYDRKYEQPPGSKEEPKEQKDDCNFIKIQSNKLVEGKICNLDEVEIGKELCANNRHNKKIFDAKNCRRKKKCCCKVCKIKIENKCPC